MFTEIRLYTPRTRQWVRQALHDKLQWHALSHHTENLLYCLDELIKNGLKANYKFCLIRQSIENVLWIKGYEKRIGAILGDRVLFNKYAARYGEIEEGARIVRRALSQEAKFVALRTQAQEEKRRLKSSELETLAASTDLILIRKLVKKYQMKTFLRLDIIGNLLEIQIVNSAPILDTDLERIHTKRAKFNGLADSGKELVFFTQHIDDSDSGAGLGYATIDAMLRGMDLDPLSVLNIVSLSNTTMMFSMDLGLLKTSGEVSQAIA